MPENELTIKEEAFYKLSEWLKEFGFAAEESDIRGETGVESKIQFEIDTYLDRGDKYLYSIVFTPEFKDILLFKSKLGIAPEYHQSLKTMRNGERIVLFTDVKKYVYPLGVNVEVSLPSFYLYKQLTINSVTRDKNYFMEQTFNFNNAIELAQIRLDEEFFPKDDVDMKDQDEDSQ